jgi:Protein of unknown function (DUF2905)
VQELGRTLLVAGGVILAVGILMVALGKLGLGHLPGDIVIRRKNFSFAFPIVTCLLISIVLSLIFWLFRRH